MSETIVTRTMQRHDLDEVLELLRASLGEPPLLKRTPELFAWKHFENPFGESISLVATSAESIVGLRSFMRWNLRTPSGALVRCVRAVDTATHPAFLRRGIFRRLTEEAVEVAKSRAIDLVFNTPNTKSGSGYLSMDWTEVGPIGVMMRPTRHFLNVGSRHETARLPDLIESAHWKRIPLSRAALGLRTPRSEDYLNWRFGSHPTARYYKVETESGQAIVRPNMRKGRNELLISDLFGRDTHRAIKRAAKSTNARYLATWFSQGTPERAAARRAGLIPMPKVTALTLMARPLRELDVDVTEMSSWDLALSDLELL